MCDKQVIIVDEMMGRGKSSAAINYINNSDERFIVITPYLDEVARYKSSCRSKKFREPIKRQGSKLSDIKQLIQAGENIVSTHALFQRFDREVIELCRGLNYNLIMDEVTEVVQQYEITSDDINVLLKNFCNLDDKGRLIWKEECQDYDGKYTEVKNLCNLGGLAIVRGKALMWLFPVEVFNAFSHVFILTYKFNAQIQRYYYDYYGIEYEYKYVSGDDVANFAFSDNPSIYNGVDYRSLIHILDNHKMNSIGDSDFSLSRTWYDRYKTTAVMKQLKNNLSNYFRHIRNDNSKDNLWTTFKDFRQILSGKGYTKGFIPLNIRATNSYKERTSVAYLVNVFLNPIVKGFFQDHNVTVDEDGYALSEMMQLIWRSAIREGNEIWVYMPSKRMRGLLYDWINEQTVHLLNSNT